MAKSTSDSLPSVPVIIGTAGHIDHGKSSLIKALTGVDPDRLKEEKKRGITIELGFAFLDERIAFIDVPGHEKFIRHMVAGAATVDFAILVIAADDGVMPQTREHLDILSLLGVQGGMVVLSKADMVDDEWIELVKDDVAKALEGSALEGAPILIADSLSGRGLKGIEREIRRMAAAKTVPTGRGHFRLPVDRIFTMKGFGTVATGSVLAGSVAVGDELELMPGGRRLRVKGLQSQGRSVEQSVAGQRCAVNLASISVDEMRRGDVLTAPEVFRSTGRLDVMLSVLLSAPAPIKHRQRVRLHIGCAELLARIVLLEEESIAPGGKGLAQLRLEAPTVALRLDRFVIRRYSPQVTIGGGVVLDATPVAHRRGKAGVIEALHRLSGSDDSGPLITAVQKTPFETVERLSVAVSKPQEEVEPLLERMSADGELLSFEWSGVSRYCDAGLYRNFVQRVADELSRFHQANPLRAGCRRGNLAPHYKTLKLPKQAALSFFEYALSMGHLVKPSGDLVALPSFIVKLDKAQKKAVALFSEKLDQAKTTPPSVAELASMAGQTKKDAIVLLTYLVDSGQVLCLEGNLFFSLNSIEKARDELKKLLDNSSGATVANIRDALGSSRKFIIPLLNHFDSVGFTRREGDLRQAGPKLFGDIERE